MYGHSINPLTTGITANDTPAGSTITCTPSVHFTNPIRFYERVSNSQPPQNINPTTPTRQNQNASPEVLSTTQPIVTDTGHLLRTGAQLSDGTVAGDSQEWTDQQITEYVRSFLSNAVKFNLFVILFSGSMMVCMNINSLFYGPLLVFLLVDLLMIILIIINIRKDPRYISRTYFQSKDPIEQKEYIVQSKSYSLPYFRYKCYMFQCQFGVATVILENKFSFTVVAVPWLGFEVFLSIRNIFLTGNNKEKKHYVLVSSLLLCDFKFKEVLRLLAVIQILIVLLKFDGKIERDWRSILTIYYGMLSGLLAITFGLFMMVLSKFCGLIFAEIEKHEMKGIFLLFLWSFGLILFISLLVSNLLDIYSQKSRFIELLPLAIGGIFYNFICLIYTTGNIVDLETFFKKLGGVSVSPQTQVEEPQRDKPKEPEKIDIPKYMTKVSSTFYRRSTEAEIAIHKKERENTAKKTDSKKQGHSRPGSLDFKSFSKASQQQDTVTNNLITIPEATERVPEEMPRVEKKLFVDPIEPIVSNRTGVPSIIPKLSARGIIASAREIITNIGNLASGDKKSARGTEKISAGGHMIEEKKEDPDENLIPSFNNSSLDLSQNMQESPLPKKELASDEMVVGMVVTTTTGENRHKRTHSLQVVNKAAFLPLISQRDKIETPKQSQRGEPPKLSFRGEAQKMSFRGEAPRISFRGDILKMSQRGEPPKLSQRGDPLRMSQRGDISRLSQRGDVPRISQRGELPKLSYRADIPGLGTPGQSARSGAGENQCLICFDKETDAVFMECGHGGREMNQWPNINRDLL